ncbi:hypothetical protein YC2023_065955 [Brassica napus]
MAMVRAKKNIVSYVRELKPRKDTSRIEVRIVRLWRNYNKESGNTIEMVVVDKEGTKIHASVGEQLIKKFDDKLREGDAIVLQLFKVYDATVPEKYSADFSDILGGNLDRSCLVGAYSISSGYNSTHILLNPTLEFIEEFKASLPDDSLALTNNDSSQWSVGTATSIRARFFVLNERLTIREIIDSTLVDTFITLGTIQTIDTERGWQYLSCKYHNKKVMPTTNVDADGRPLFFCNTCDKENSDVISRLAIIGLDYNF